MPTLTKADAIIKAADDLSHALEGNLPQNCTTETAIKQLMEIFKQEAANYVRLKNVPRKRVSSEVDYTPAQRVTETPSQRVNDTPTNKDFEDMYDDMPTLVPPGPNMISQEDEPQPRRSRYQTRSITQELMLQTMEISGGAATFSAQQASRR